MPDECEANLRHTGMIRLKPDRVKDTRREHCRQDALRPPCGWPMQRPAPVETLGSMTWHRYTTSPGDPSYPGWSPAGGAGFGLGAEPMLAARGVDARAVIIALAGQVIDMPVRGHITLDRAALRGL